ncbi:reverse transcriptase [Senna tora]|uniref:Reverse transcriptase n=1 Tax=Senna tora TaxID=362788 RepID=A0A834SI20_9FABA|nr:reverse transcriptase [Senna tora]
MDPFRVLAWNVRGACNGDFKRVFWELANRNKPNIVVLTETRVGRNRAQNIMNSLGFDSTHRVDPMGYTGGIWILWDSRDINLSIRGSTFQEVHALAEDEKWGGLLASQSRIRDFKSCLDNCGLVDLGFSGCKYTWCNKRPSGQLVFERIDRFVANASWISLFPDAVNYHLPRVLITRNWSIQGSALNALKVIKEVLIIWNREIFGNIFYKKNVLLNRLQGISVALSQNPNTFLVRLESQLDKELRAVLQAEEERWASKSRMNWLMLADSNSRYFHASVLGRRRQNRITCLKNEVGEWIHEPDELNNLIINHFKGIYRASVCSPLPNWLRFSASIAVLNISLDSIPSHEEVTTALFSLNPFKAAGRDGFQPAFFQKSWATTSTLVVKEVQDCFRNSTIPKEWNKTMGDPISPYLFILCMETLTKLINAAITQKQWTPPKIKGLTVSHLFADAVLLFGRAYNETVKSIKRVMDAFQDFSGLAVNPQKLVMWFSNNTPDHLKSGISNLLNFKSVSSLGKYLGFPLGSPGRASDFKEIIDRISGKMDLWKSKYLSPMGKITLINSVVTPIASYFMQCLYFPISVCDTLDKLRIHMVAWEKITKPKKLGGLGIHKSHERNLARLAKLYWRTDRNNNRLWAKIGRVALDLSITQNTIIDNIGQFGCLRSLISGPLNLNENDIRALPVDLGSPIEDTTVWSGSLNGNFSLKSAYFLICASSFSWDMDINWAWIWKLECHSRQRIFIWSLLTNGLPIRGSLAMRAPSYKDIPHGTLFIYLLWHIWIARNKKVFENSDFSVANIVFLAKGKAGEFSFLSVDKESGRNQSNHPIQIRWNPSPPNWLKLNTDGSCLSNSAEIGAGGSLRDSMGNWVRCFSIFIGHGNAILAELWGVYHRLLLAYELLISNIVVEANSLVVINLLKASNHDTNHHLSTLIRKCRSILCRFDRVLLQYVHREGNYCADFLARKATSTRCNLVSIQHALPALYHLLLADCLGVETPRRAGIG